MWLCMFGGAGLYLCALNVLYDLEHGVYTMGHGGASELGLNLATAVLIAALWLRESPARELVADELEQAYALGEGLR